MSKFLGIYLNELYMKTGLSLEEAAREMGAENYRVISNWENGGDRKTCGLVPNLLMRLIILDQDLNSHNFRPILYLK